MNNSKPIIPIDAHSLEVFAIKESNDSPTGKEGYIGFKLRTGSFHYISVPFTEPEENSLEVKTIWRKFSEYPPEPLQEIYVLDKYGEIKPSIHQGDKQLKYWVFYEYLWTPRPIIRL